MEKILRLISEIGDGENLYGIKSGFLRDLRVDLWVEEGGKVWEEARDGEEGGLQLLGKEDVLLRIRKKIK